jgi:anti-sigma factor RsiW
MRRPKHSLIKRSAVAAGILLMVGSFATLGMILTRTTSSTEDRLADWVVACHVRSLQVDHLNDVVSSDRHTVKPWFRGKLDFSPQVPDLSEQGYTLSGGRLDYVFDRSVAALVYHRRLHAINLLIWPHASNDEKAVRVLARQGFHIRHWQRSGMNYWAISDLNDEELENFVRLYQEHSKELNQ